MTEEKMDEFEYENIEATDKEFKGVCYTGICLVAFAVVAIGAVIFAVAW